MRRTLLAILVLAASFASAEPLRVGGDVKAPVVLSRVAPVYTAEAKARHIAGVVIVEVVIDRAGSVTDAQVLKGLPSGLSESALAAVKQWKFSPATLNGQPVDVIFNLVVQFAPKEDAPSDARDTGGTGITTVILVRHAEKAVPGAGMNEDPPLSAAGEERARDLARVLRDAGIDAIYTTNYTRTRNTAAPIAAALHLTPEEVKAGATYPADMAALIATKHAGHTVLVVGHSNTTRDVMRQLGVANAPNIDDAEYDNLFIVTLCEGQAPRMTRLRYGH